jgi:phenylalanyl-tRNA synthetase alpha chain
MSVASDLREHADAILHRLPAIETVAELDALEREALGPESPVVEARRSLREASDEERREVGRAVNAITSQLESALGATREALGTSERDAELQKERLDMTLPGREPPRGAVHLVRQVWDEVVDIFIGLGYTVATGPEVDTDYHNFKALNYPDAHPARLATDPL